MMMFETTAQEIRKSLPNRGLNKGRILVVDDEEDIVEVLSYNLEREGYEVVKAFTGEEALKLFEEEKPDLVLLDLMLPGIDGLDVCRKLKSISSVPIIMISARGEELDVVMGLELGAEDYITKPFSQRILLARVKATLRRGTPPEPQEDEIRIHNIVINNARHEVFVGSQKIELTPTEFMLLSTLAKRAGFVLTRYQIVEAVRGADFAVTARSVDVQIVGLRRKLREAAEYIETVRGIGYRMRD